MTERIQHIISEIRSKALELHRELERERQKNQELQMTVQDMNEQLLSMKMKEEQLQSVVDSLRVDLDEAKNQVVEVSVPQNGRNEEEIDELVKEIEYCISQLKR